MTYESEYDAWKTTDPRDREEIIPEDEQEGFDPDVSEDPREYDEDHD
jgi:hypothetical protein